MPALPALMKLRDDPAFRRALQEADLALADSGLLAVIWKLTTGRKLQNVSGIVYLRALIDADGIQPGETVCWIFSSAGAKEKAVRWLSARGRAVDERNCLLAAGGGAAQNYGLLLEIEERRPKHIILATMGGTQEELALYLREYLLHRPAIHCVGAALALLSGEESPIPTWAQRSHLGWVIRFLAQPGMILPRLGIALALTGMVFRYGSELPPLRPRWADV
jgi:UDP-N-acetyl-D-mannosaminuronic acid transferase (WecB/TagA/CpsF family)